MIVEDIATMGRRVGRKRQMTAKRRETTRQGQGREEKIIPPDEQIAKKLAVLGPGATAADLAATRSPIAIMAYRGMLDDIDEDLGVLEGVAMGYAALYWHNIGKPFGKVPFYGATVGKGSVSDPMDILTLNDERRERLYKHLTDAMVAVGRDCYLEVRCITADHDLPEWFERAVAGTMTPVDERNRQALFDGLRALLKARSEWEG
ncbi:MAG: hypothetical protein CMF31_05160 [Kordiimonas sp.]|nr:hypothetical protein [Kordiimonas sp.]